LVRDDPMQIGRRYLKFGVTTVQFCLGALPWDKWRSAAAGVRNAMRHAEPDASRVAGLYAEGIFLIPRLAGGSQGTLAMPADDATVQRVLDDLGDVLTLVNVSPGVEGDVAAIRRFIEAGKRVSMAHSDVPAEQVYPCVDAG